MIDIRPDQLQMFLEKARKTFVGRVVAYLKANHAEWAQTLQPAELDAVIRRQVAAAEGYGLTSEVAVVQFIEIGFAFGEDFHSSGKYPEAERILLQDVDSGVKVQQLRDAATRGLEPAGN